MRREVFESQLERDHPCFSCGVRSAAICGALSPEELRDFKRWGCTARFRTGDNVAFEGDVAASVYSVTQGLLRLSTILPDGRRLIAGFLFPGDFLGITMEDRHALTAEAIMPSVLCRFPRVRFDLVVAEHASLKDRLYRFAARQLATTRQQLLMLGRMTAAERLASFLMTLAERCPGERPEEVQLPMSRTDIADYLGLRIETVSRELTSLKTSGVIRITGRQSFLILDGERLRDISAR